MNKERIKTLTFKSHVSKKQSVLTKADCITAKHLLILYHKNTTCTNTVYFISKKVVTGLFLLLITCISSQLCSFVEDIFLIQTVRLICNDYKFNLI